MNCVNCKYCGKPIHKGLIGWLHTTGWAMCKNEMADSHVTDDGTSAAPDTELDVVTKILIKYESTVSVHAKP